MKRRSQYALLAGVLALLVGGLVARALFGRKPQPTHAVVVFDRSDSTRDVCDSVTGVVTDLLANQRWPKGSSIVLLATGDSGSLGEPVEVFRFEAFRRKRTVEGRSAAARQERELLASLRAACESVPRTRTSPIYLAVRRGAEMLSQSRCAPSRCSLSVVTDGEETIEPGLAAALRGSGKRPPVPPPIPNRAFRVSFCGMAETVAASPPTSTKKRPRGKKSSVEPKRDAARADRLTELWRNVFMVPASVEVSPVCPKRKDA